MSKMHDPPEPMQSEFHPSVPQMYAQAPPAYAPVTHNETQQGGYTPYAPAPEPGQPVFTQPMPQNYAPQLVRPVVTVPYFGTDPIPATCPHCQRNIVTLTRPVSGKITYTTAILCCVFG